MSRWYKGEVVLDNDFIWKKSLNGDYWVSENGDLVNANTGYKLNPTESPTGYLKIGGQTGTYSVHRAVYEAFVGKIPEGLQINHLDGDKLNNHISNLELCTPQENVIHAYATGLSVGRGGEDNSMSKFTEEQVKSVYELSLKGYCNQSIESVTGIPWKHVSQLRTGGRWKKLFKECNMEVTRSTGQLPFPIPKCVYILNVCQNKELTNKEIAERFGMDTSTISRIRGGKTWKALFSHIKANKPIKDVATS